MSAPARRVKDAHCGWCGAAYAPGQPWPRVCAGCGQTTWRNPTPVAVALLPVDDGLLLIRRTIEPARGRLALPGGYVDLGESWQRACARELAEETGVTIDAGDVRHVATLSPPDGATVLIFGEVRPRDGRPRRRADLPGFTATSETSELTVGGPGEALGFPLHQQVYAEWFARRS